MGVWISVKSGWRLAGLAAAIAAAVVSGGSVVGAQAPLTRWSPMATPLAMAGAATAELNGKLYVMGGFPTGGGYGSADVSSYDPATHTWAAVAPMNFPRSRAAAVAVNGTLYVIGGYSQTGQSEPAVEAYDPVANTWTERSPFPGGALAARISAVVVAAGTKIYVLGGQLSWEAGFGVPDSIEVYDTEADSWSSPTNLAMPVPHMIYPRAAALNNHIYLVAGASLEAQQLQPLDRVWDLDLATGEWTARALLPTSRVWSGVAVRSGLIYSVGGYNYNSSLLKSVDVYDPVTDSFAPAPEMTAASGSVDAVSIGRRIYALVENGTSVSVEILHDEVEAPQCLVGKYLANPADTSCTPAPPGSFVGTVGATSATLCAPGSYSDWFGAITCLPAPPGSFVSGDGATAPTPCPLGSLTMGEGAVTCVRSSDVSLRFTGSQAVVVAPPNPTVRQVSAWVKYPLGGGGPIISQWGTTTPGFRFAVELLADGHIRATGSGRAVRLSRNTTLVSSAAIAPDTWTHVTVQFTDRVVIFIDGGFDSSSTTGSAWPTFPADASLQVGAIDSPMADGQPHFTGQITSVQIRSDIADPSVAMGGATCFGSYSGSLSEDFLLIPLDDGFGDYMVMGLTIHGWDPSAVTLMEPAEWVNDGPGAAAFCRGDSTPPRIDARDVTVPATDPAGVSVTFAPVATDEFGFVPVACEPASPSHFAIGAHSVTCTATDAAGNVGSATLTVTVLDGVRPVITVQPPPPVEATSAAGAVVTFDLQVSDNMPGLLTAACSHDSGSVFPVGTTPVSCMAADAAGNLSLPATFDVVVFNPIPGAMHGEGVVTAGDDRYRFRFHVREQAGGERGKFSMEVDYATRPALDKKGKPTMTKPDDGRFRSTAVTAVTFSDDPTSRPGRSPKVQVDTVLFSGTGDWNGSGSHTFEVRAVDQGEPGQHRESIAIVIRDAAGQIVAQASGVLASGNVQSTRIKH